MSIAAELDERGVAIVRGALSEDVLASLGRAFDDGIDRLARQRGLGDLIDDEWRTQSRDERYKRLRGHLKAVSGSWRKLLVSPEIYAMWQVPALLDLARPVLGDDVYAHPVWNGRPRESFTHQRVHWHQDAHYYKGWDPADGRLLSMWMPLVPVREDTSCLQFVPGSHRRGWIERIRDENQQFTVPDEHLDGAEVLTAEMEPGDVVVFTDTTLHQSTDMVGDGIRWSLDIRFSPYTPAFLEKSPRGYRCAPDPEPYETWAARYEYEPVDLVEELENFAGFDPEKSRRWVTRDPGALDVY